MSGAYALLLLLTLGLAESACPRCASLPTDPVCASDGKTYRTPCTVEKLNCKRPALTLVILYPGECVDYASSYPQPVEPQPRTLFQPVNCSVWPGPKFAPCPRSHDPRCGNDLNNYNNECEMCRTGKPALTSRHKGRCTDYEMALNGKAYPVGLKVSQREITPLRFPRAPNCRAAIIPCGRTYGHLVCGSNGVTYSSECELCNLKREAEIRGEAFDVMIIKVGGIC